MNDTIPHFRIDGGKRLGPFRRIHGVNGGPKYKSGQLDFRPAFRAIAPDTTRLHDVSLLAGIEAVDVHCIFPLVEADPDDPGNYLFAKTDDYLRWIREIDSEIVFRLGEPIEHGSPQFHVHPPADPGKWARVCGNIVRHYNRGWADGHEWHIRYWEVWNEPNIAPCWSGTMQQYCELYRHVAAAVKAADPEAMVGGPALAGTPDSAPGRQFLQYVRDHELPLDFVSWHSYAATPRQLIEHVQRGLAVMAEFGFAEVESHFNEWNQFAGDFKRAIRDPEYGRGMLSRTRQAEGAAFAASTLAGLARTDLDVANYYAAFPGCRLGLFDMYMVPGRNYDALVAFRRLIDCGEQIAATGGCDETGLMACAAAAAERHTAAVLLSNFSDPADRARIDLSGLDLAPSSQVKQYVIDETHSLSCVSSQVIEGTPRRFELPLPAPSVHLMTIEPASG